jgi:hypothetical protein
MNNLPNLVQVEVNLRKVVLFGIAASSALTLRIFRTCDKVG